MSKIYRFEVSTLWPHPEAGFTKRREMVYDFIENDLATDERSWFNGQNFYDPKTSPHIYADQEKAQQIYSNLERLLEDWEPLDFMKDSEERVQAFRLISVDENGDENVEAESDRLADLITANPLFKNPQV